MTKRSQVPKQNWPDFAREAKEAPWWESAEGQAYGARMLEKARKEAKLVRRGNAVFAADRVPAKTMSIRLPERDLERARALARHKGVGMPCTPKPVAAFPISAASSFIRTYACKSL